MDKTINHPLQTVAGEYLTNIALEASGYNLVYYLNDKINDENVHIYRFEHEGNLDSTRLALLC